MSFEPREYLRHILAETEYLIEQSDDRTLDDFRRDETLQRAFIRSLEVIGEAVKNRARIHPLHNPSTTKARCALEVSRSRRYVGETPASARRRRCTGGIREVPAS